MYESSKKNNKNTSPLTIDKESAETHTGLKLLAKSSFIVAITLIFSKIFLYLYRITIARHYGPEIYGLFTLSIAIISWFRLFSGLGIKEGLLRYISLFIEKKEKRKTEYFFKKSISLLIFTSLLSSILLFFFSDFIALKIFSDADLIIFLKIFSVSIPFMVLGTTFLSVLRAFEKIGWFSFISNILGNFIQLAILILLVFIGINSVSVPISYLIGIFFIFIISYLVSNNALSKILNNEKINNLENKKVFKEMLSYSWPFIFYGVIGSIFYWTDSFIIGIFKNAEYVGFYNAAVPISALLLLPFSFFGQLFFPLVTKEFSKRNLGVVKQLTQQVGKWIFMIALPLFVLFMIFPGFFINFLFGPEYIIAENSLRFLSTGVLFLALFSVSQELLAMKGKSKLILMDMLLVAIINIILNSILIPSYGITGAGFATMISSIILSILFLIQAYKNFHIIPLRRKMLRILLIISLPILLLFVIRSFIEINLLSVIFCGIFFIALYILLILTTNCLDDNDWHILKSIFRKIRKK